MEGGEKVCLREEVGRMLRSGLTVSEISESIGLDEAWIEGIAEAEQGVDRRGPEDGEQAKVSR